MFLVHMSPRLSTPVIPFLKNCVGVLLQQGRVLRRGVGKFIYLIFSLGHKLDKFYFGVPRIELGSHEPESCILPVYYTPRVTYCQIFTSYAL